MERQVKGRLLDEPLRVVVTHRGAGSKPAAGACHAAGRPGRGPGRHAELTWEKGLSLSLSLALPLS